MINCNGLLPLILSYFRCCPKKQIRQMELDKHSMTWRLFKTVLKSPCSSPEVRIQGRSNPNYCIYSNSDHIWLFCFYDKLRECITVKSGHDRYQRVTRSFSFTLYVDEQSISMMINTGTVVSCTDDVTTSKHKQTVSILKRKKTPRLSANIIKMF